MSRGIFTDQSIEPYPAVGAAVVSGFFTLTLKETAAERLAD